MKFGPIGVLEALKMAIQSETDVGQFFSEASKVTDDDTVKDIFRKYGREERKRQKELQEKYRRISGKRLLYLNLNKKHKLEMSMDYSSDREDVLAAARQNLEACLSFYEDVSSRLLEPDYRGIFRNLAEDKGQQLALLDAKFPKADEEQEDLKGNEESHSTVSEAA